MKLTLKFALIIIFFILIAFPSNTMAGYELSDRIIFGENFRLLSGEVLDGSLVVFGGSVILEQGSTVERDVVIFGGNLEAAGDVRGSIVSLGGNIKLTSTSITEGDVITVGGNLDRMVGALVEGDVASEIRPPMTFIYPGKWEIPSLAWSFPPIFNVISFTFTLFLWAGVAVLIVLFLPSHTQRISKTVVSQPLLAGGLGLLTVIVIPPMLVILLITLLLSPLALMGAAVALMAWIFGFVAVGYELGNRLAASMRSDWAPALSAGIGTFLLMLVVNGVRWAVPCIGWTVSALVGIMGLGAVLLTRFGIQQYPLAQSTMPFPAKPPAPASRAESILEEVLPDPLGDITEKRSAPPPPDSSDTGN